MSYLKSRNFEKEDPNVSNEKRQIKNNRPISARMPDKTQTVPLKRHVTNQVTTFRPSTGKSVTDINALIRNLPKSPNANRERLYEENLSLKVKANLLQEENLKLRTKINQIEKDLNKKEENVPESLLKISSKTHLIPNLKISIKDLKDLIKNKEEEIEKLKKNIKCTKMNEIDVEIQSYIDECTRLRHHLDEVMAQKQISYASLEFEEKLYRQNMDINILRQENQEYSLALEKAREEMVFVKEKISILENPVKKSKKNSNKKIEINKLRSEIAVMKEKLEKDKEQFMEKEEKLKSEAQNIAISNEKICEKIQLTEIKLQEQNIMLEQLKSQMVFNEKEFKRSQTINATSSEAVHQKKKLNDPPKLLRRIHQIITKKQMLSSVFFSLMDKNNNGYIDIEEIYQFIFSNGKKIKRKDIISSLEYLGIDKSSLTITIMEEHYDKYQYSQKSESPVSSEEILDPPKKNQIERLTYSAPKPPSNEAITPKPTVFTTLVVKEIVKIPKVRLEEIQNILEEIAMKMKISKQPKNKLLSIIFGNDIDVDQEITLNTLVNIFLDCKLKLEDKEKVKTLSRFLLEPENLNEYPEDLTLKGNIFEICKKLMKNIQDWEIYSNEDLKNNKRAVEVRLAIIAEKLKEHCQKCDEEKTGYINIKAFRKIVESLEEMLTEKMWDIWTMELYPSYMLNYSEFLLKIGPKSPEASLSMIASKLNHEGISPESIFSVTSQGIISAEGFIEGINKLGLSLSNSDLLQLLEAIRHKAETSFTMIVHITELRRLLNRFGLKSQTISSSCSDIGKFSPDDSNDYIKEENSGNESFQSEYSED